MDGFRFAQYQDPSSNNIASKKALSLVSYHPPIEIEIGIHEHTVDLSAVCYMKLTDNSAQISMQYPYLYYIFYVL